MNLYKKAKKRNLSYDELEKANNLTPETFNLLKDMIPTKYKFMMEYLLAISSSDENTLLSYGISQIRKSSLIVRMAESIKSGTKIKENLRSDNISKQALTRLLQIHCEKSKVFVNKYKSCATEQQALKYNNPELYNKILGIVIIIIIIIIII